MMTMMKTPRKMKKNRVISAAALVWLLAGSISIAAGQKKLDPHQPYALIFGTVFGPDDHPIRGIKIKIRREGQKKTVEMLSDSRGEFAQRFPAGKADYIVWADLKDKQAAHNTEVKVHVEDDERHDLTIHLTKTK
jgi:hypothetical protein